jgi:hypothetical protein
MFAASALLQSADQPSQNSDTANADTEEVDQMGEGFRVVPDELRSYAEYVGAMMGDFDAIDHYARDQGANTAGCTGLLTVLQPVVAGVGKLFGAALAIGKDRLGATAEGLEHSAATYEAVDRNEAATADRLASQLHGAP